MQSPILARPAEKNFAICPRCPYYCRTEERISLCPWCNEPLRLICACGAAIRDPSLQACEQCDKPLRIEARTTEVAPPASPRATVRS